jgi:GntR family transcriptional regulator, arabinose operon transcriptional repressor
LPKEAAQNSTLYLRLLTELRQQILDGRLPEGARLPSEADLSDSYGISRGTVRHALGILTNEGLIERRKGSGSYVRALNGDGTAAYPSSRQIGLVLSQSSDQLNMEILIGVEQGAKARGYHVIFSYAEENAEQQQRDIQRLIADNVEGLILFPASEDPTHESIAQLKEHNIPFVLTDRYFPEFDSDYVAANNFDGGYRATEHLLILGYRRIAFVHAHSSDVMLTSIRDRWAGYRAALEHYGLPYDEGLVYCAPAKGYYEEFFARQALPDAIFAVNDLEALAILKTSKRLGLRIPQDIALVGFDDLSFAAHLHPPLTTVAQMRMELGLRAVNLLIDRIEGASGAFKHIELPTRLIVRESCGARLKIQPT